LGRSGDGWAGIYGLGLSLISRITKPASHKHILAHKSERQRENIITFFFEILLKDEGTIVVHVSIVSI
jgi:hypothetical protein